jgi:hypothetical protein
LGFEPLAFVGEAGGEPLHEVGDQRVGLFDRVAWLVDETRLDLLPARSEAPALVVGQERAALDVRRPAFELCRLGRRQVSAAACGDGFGRPV